MEQTLYEIRQEAENDAEVLLENIHGKIVQCIANKYFEEPQEDKCQGDYSDLDTFQNSEDWAMRYEADRLLRKSVEALQNQDTDTLNSLVGNFQRIAFEYSADIEELIDNIEECNDKFKIEEIEIIHTNDLESIIIPELIIPFNEFIFDKIKSNINYIYNLNPRQFEELIAELFYKSGYEVELTKATRDGGKDIIAISRTLDIPIKFVIECKRYSQGRKVGIEYVQRLL